MTSPTLDPSPHGLPGSPGDPAPVPAPPQGPGVFPPFPAPPVEGKGRRIGLGLGIGAGVLLLVCAGGVAAVIGLVTVANKALGEQVHVVVGDYFQAVEAKKYDDAYEMLCPEERDHVTQAEFVDAEQSADAIATHRVGDLDLTSVDLTVPVAVTYTDGKAGTLQVHLAQSSDTGAFQVCGVEE